MKATDNILREIKQALALCKSSTDPDVAATALRQVCGIVQQHAADLPDRDVQTHSVRAHDTQIPARWELLLASSVALMFSAQVLQQIQPRARDNGTIRRIKGVRKWMFVGVGRDAELAGYTFSALLRQCERARSDYINDMLQWEDRFRARVSGDDYCQSVWVKAALKDLEHSILDNAKIVAVADWLRHNTTPANYEDEETANV